MNDTYTNDEWISCFDPNTNSPYYYNTRTGISQWELPPILSSPIGQQYSRSPGGMRIKSENSNQENIPTLIKMKSKSGQNLGSFRTMNNKILPITSSETNEETLSLQMRDNLSIKKDPYLQKSSRPTVKLKGSSLLNLKRAPSNQQLEIDTSTPEQQAPPFESPDPTYQSELPSQHPSHPSKSLASSPAPTRDYIAMAQSYHESLPYSEHYFDTNTKCYLCQLHTPLDILFPCNHRCICRGCLSQSPYVQFLSTSSESPFGEKDMMHRGRNDKSLTPETKQKKVPCPLCNLVIRLIIPINGKGTEEKEYWDWLLASGNGPGGPANTLDDEFIKLFSNNIPHILEKSLHSTLSTPISREDDRTLRYESNRLPHESDESSEMIDPFPQFSPFEDSSLTLKCCIIQ